MESSTHLPWSSPNVRFGFMVTINITLSIAIALPSFLVSNSNLNFVCTETWLQQHSLIYSWVTFLVGFLLPILVISFVYVRMLRKLKTFQSRIKQNLSDRQQLQRQKDNKRMNLILACLIIAFFALVLPNKIYWILEDHGVWIKHLTRNQQEIVRWIVFSAYILHASINPLIYSVVDKRFRSNLLAIFCRRDKTNPENRQQGPAFNLKGTKNITTV